MEATVADPQTLRPMTSFDPSRPALVHNRLTDTMLRWPLEWAESYRRRAREHEPGAIGFDGLLLDGWTPPH